MLEMGTGIFFGVGDGCGDFFLVLEDACGDFFLALEMDAGIFFWCWRWMRGFAL